MKAFVHGTCALALLLASAPARPALAAPPIVSYAPPAGALPAGPLHGSPTAAVLPSGRLVTPAGTSAVTGLDGLGLALSPDGRFAIVGNDDDGSVPAVNPLDPDATDGPSLAVLDTVTMSVVSRFHAPAGERYLGAVVAVTDPLQPAQTLVLAAGGSTNAVYAFTLDGFGRLSPDPRHRIAIPGPIDPAFGDWMHSTPTGLTVSADGRRVYAVDTVGGTVATIDLATRRLAGTLRPVGFFPSDAAVAGSRLLVTNEGMMRYGVVVPRTAAPPFGAPPAALDRASSLSLIDIGAGGVLAPAPLDTAGPASVPMDPPVDGLRIVGGAHPSAVAVAPDGRTAFVAVTNVDRVATVALDGVPHAVGGTELRLFDRGPYGTQPAALALSRDGSRLYVALRGLNAVAVIDARDPLHLHRLGLIPTGWAPAALTLSGDDRTLYVANQKGFGDDAGAVWSTLQRIDLAAVKLPATTRATLAATRHVVTGPVAYPKALANVVTLVLDHQTFDAVFGDLGGTAGDPELARNGAAVTPNLHALAARYALATNLYTATDDAHAHQAIVSGLATAFGETAGGEPGPVFAGADDPEDAPRIGSIFTELARHGVAFRDYGGFLRVAGFDGAGYGYDVPAPAALEGHVDLDYPAPAGAGVSDTRRAVEFERDYDAQLAAGTAPRYAYVWFPGTQPADTDAAVGAVVDHLSHLPSWKRTVVFVVAASGGGAADHVDPARTFALVVSAYAKRHYLGRRHLSTASVLKTVDGLFGMPPLSLGDLLAGDMSDFFTTSPDLRPYVAVERSPQS